VELMGGRIQVESAPGHGSTFSFTARFGVAEPVMHFLTPPVGDGGTSAAAREAMKLTYFHWGLHAWSIYAIVALILAYFSFRHRLPLTLRSALYPLIGERIYGPIGVAVDVFAIVGTTFGVATSLGFGVEQISTGLHHVFGIPDGLATQLILVLATMSLATVSVLLGLDAGIRRLSVLNIGLAVALLTLVAAVGPSVLLAQSLVENTGNYLADLVGKTFNLYAYDPTDWLGGWTIFYWGWWMSWAPFVGLFIARISRGRTIREFVLGAMLGPTAFTLVWMTVFGNTAIDLILNQGLAELGAQVQADESVALFRFFEELPLSSLLSVTALVMVLIFFVTSADSGALVLNMLSSHGSDRTPALRKLFWMGIITSAAVVLLIAGGLSALQTAAIASAFPFSLALLAAMWGFVKALRIDDAKRQALLAANVAPPPGSGEEAAWRLRLHNLLEFPHRAKLVHFLDSTVVPAMRQFAEALAEHGVESSIDTGQLDRGTVRLVVHHDDEADFVYSVVAATQPSPPLADRDAGEYVRAEVHLSEGGQDYCIMGWTLGQVRSDILNQYSSHLQFLHVLR
ncbi:MAG: BCCT family transporter, partial [Pseudomonadota bacterium]